MSSFYSPENKESSLEIRAAHQAGQVRKQAYKVIHELVRGWVKTYHMFWDEDTNGVPAQKRMDALGSDAGELIRASAALVMFLNQELAGRNDELLAEVNERIAALPGYTIDENGLVTLAPPPE